MAAGKSKYRVLVAAKSDRTHDFVEQLLPPSDYEQPLRAHSAGEARRALLSARVDVVVINAPLPDEFGVDFALDLCDQPVGVLLLVPGDEYEQVCYRVESGGVATLPRPTTRAAVYGAVRLLTAVSARLCQMEKKNRTLQEKMADIRVVNRAKWLLIENHNMSEREAHYYIEKQAMDTRMSRREVAESIIRTYDK